MKTIERASGLKVILPPQFEIVETNKPSRKKPRSRRGGPFRPVRMPTGGKSTPMASDMMTAAFGGQEMQLLDQVEIDPGDEARRDTRRKRSPQVIEFNLEVGQKEDAVVLLEQDGMHSWQFPGKDTSRQKRSHRGEYTDADFTRNIKFRIPLTSHPADKRPSGKRGLIEDFVMDKIRAYIFKFAARVAVGQVMKYLERNVQRGLINMRNIEDAAKWELISDPASLKLPKNRPARILLFVHGTFSSTIGGYGVLTATPWGREFLRAAYSNYDAVIGFDHATLSEDPLENATDLLHCLQAIRWPVPPRFDVITHSRGGLVIRSLLEHLLPLDDFSPAFERVIFVAVTNGGTQLAKPDNWNTLIDMYTNISAAAFRLIGMLPQAKGATVLLNEIVKGVGALVKYCAATAIDEREVPGLAAMEPNGKFILRLNEQQLKQPTIKNSYYCAITSDFKPDLTGDDIEPKELPARFLFWAANVFADQLMKEPNDLVVNTASMTHVDPRVGRYIKDSLDFGTNPHVYHTNYFVQPDVIGALTRWLSLAAEPVSKGKRRSVAAGKEEAYLDLLAKALPPSDSVALGGLSRIELPAMVDTDIFITNAMAPFNEVANLIERKKPSYLVIRREYLGNTLNYAFPAEDVLSMGGGPGNQASLLDALNLHESDRSNDLSLVSLTKPVTMTGGSAVARRGVVLIGEEPVGVLPEKIAPSGAATLADLVRLTTAPKTSGDEIRARRI
ncbi:MAG TPA: hypothetical protein PLX14_09135, partial [Anaerolineales bacterium]|nr:hypothetical protein [Anaerolineales bacterium]